MITGVKNKDKFYNLCYKYAGKFIKENENKIKKAKNRFQKAY